MCNRLEDTLVNASYNSLIRLYRILAEAALTHYDVGSARLALLSYRHNTVFRVDASPRVALSTTADPMDEGEDEPEFEDDNDPLEEIAKASPYSQRGTRYVLRLCDLTGPSEEMIRSEAQWLLALRQGNEMHNPVLPPLPVPEPVAGRDGSYVLRIQIEGVDLTCYCLLLRWMPGRLIDSGLSPTLFERVGIVQAHLHQQAQSFLPADNFVRPHQDWLQVLTSTITHISEKTCAHSGLLNVADRHLLERAAERASKEIAVLPDDSCHVGLIHGDFQQVHYLFDRGKVNAIGFDRCCYDYFLSDSAVTLQKVAKRDDASSLFAAYWRGYAHVLPIPERAAEGIETFSIAHILQCLNTMAQVQDFAKRDEFTRYLSSNRERLSRFVAASVQ